jgi:hypothetical protein
LINDPRRGRLRSYKGQPQVVDDSVHRRIVREEGDDLHLTALMEPLTLLHEYCKAAALRAEHRIDLVNFTDHLGPAPPGDLRSLFLDDDQLPGRLLRLAGFPPMGIKEER